MSSPVSITVKALVTVAMLGVTGSLMRQNSQIKSNIAVTQSNIQTLKNEHKQKLAKPKKVNFTSAYQKAEATGNKLVPVITQYANTSLDQMKNSENSWVGNVCTFWFAGGIREFCSRVNEQG